MKIRAALAIGMGMMIVLGGLGCKRKPKDTSRVLATIGTEKITEKEFGDMVRLMAKDEKVATAYLKDDARKEQRIQMLDQLAKGKALIQMGKAEGLDKDATVKTLLEQDMAKIYFQTLVDKRLPKGSIPEAELRTIYDQAIGQAKAQPVPKGQPQPVIPPFDQVKPQLEIRWKQQKQQSVSEALLQELEKKIPMTFAEDYKPGK